MSISVAGMIAVIKIIIAGVKYMLSDVITSKEEAKKDIKGALLGLILIMSAVLILQVINPQLTNLKIQSVEVEKPDINRTFACEPLNEGLFDGTSACATKGEVARTSCLKEEKSKCDELVDGYLKAECNRIYQGDASGNSWGKCTTLGQKVREACKTVTEDPGSYDTASDGKKYFCDRSRAACTKIGGTPVFDGATAKIICRN